jgi:hypothetical protein
MKVLYFHIVTKWDEMSKNLSWFTTINDTRPKKKNKGAEHSEWQFVSLKL